MQKIVEINGSNLTIEDVVAVARYGAKVKLDEKQKDKILESRKYVEDALFNKIRIITKKFNLFRCMWSWKSI